jgi:hypothetical protein
MAEDRDEDIREVMKEEKARGTRQPKSAEAKRERAKLLQEVKKLLESGTEEDVKAYIRAEGIPADSPAALNFLKTWRENRQF